MFLQAEKLAPGPQADSPQVERSLGWKNVSSQVCHRREEETQALCPASTTDQGWRQQPGMLPWVQHPALGWHPPKGVSPGHSSITRGNQSELGGQATVWPH